MLCLKFPWQFEASAAKTIENIVENGACRTNAKFSAIFSTPFK